MSPWSRRVLHTVPPMPDWLWVTFLGALLFLAGMVAGMALCVSSSTPVPALTTLPRPVSYQDQLDALDARVRTLEQR